MAFFARSRFNRFPRRRMAMGRSRFRRLRDPQRTKGLEHGQFFIEEALTLPTGSAAETSIYTHLGSIPFSVGQATGASPEQRVGQVMQSQARYMQINGIVMDWGIKTYNRQGDVIGDDGDFYSSVMLLTDRVDYNTADSPTPASVGSYSPFDNYWPTTVLSTTEPSITNRQPTQPTRIHWQKTQIHSLAPGRIGTDEEGVLYSFPDQGVTFRGGTLNRRLRIRLDDNHAFFLAWFFRNNPNFLVTDDSRNIKRWARGHIYYRWVS